MIKVKCWFAALSLALTAIASVRAAMPEPGDEGGRGAVARAGEQSKDTGWG
ncbi:hypothetical protein [Streptomyces sp. HSG2]|uniref:hypothetical protein n=1 Tax=Streptomyces sp. HSG2 TaxID=2797167 RepID=UPI0019031FE8|nr:hypothetical protein [Streptomyces sp. HSG2]